MKKVLQVLLGLTPEVVKLITIIQLKDKKMLAQFLKEWSSKLIDELTKEKKELELAEKKKNLNYINQIEVVTEKGL